MEYKYIVNPRTNRKCRTDTVLGKRIIRNYLKYSNKSMSGGFQWGTLISQIFSKTDNPYWVYTGTGDEPFSKEAVIQILKDSYRLTADEKKLVEEFVNKTWTELAGASIEALEDVFLEQWKEYKKVYAPPLDE